MSGQGVHAVVVTYEPDEAVRDTVRAVRSQVERIVVVDNGSGPGSAEILERLARDEGAEILRLGSNLGLAAGQNRGIAEALDHGAAWVLLLDQDSRSEPGMVDALLAGAREAGGTKLGLVCPVVGMAGERPAATPGPGLEEVGYAIASGCLVPAQTLRDVGGMREDYFIDSVDFEFSLRLRSRGYRLLRARDAVLVHRLGTRVQRKLGPFRLELTVHSPARRYHVFRNHVWLLRDYAGSAPGLLAKKSLFLGLLLGQILLLEEDRATQLREAWRGLRDGLGGR